MMLYRVRTIMVGRNLPLIIQDEKAEMCDAGPLLWLMLRADAEPLDAM